MKRNLILLIIFCAINIVIFSQNTYANIFTPHIIRQANSYIKHNKLEKAEIIYSALPNNKKIAFNKGYLYAKKNEAEKSEQYYAQCLQNSKSTPKEKARLHFNLGNNSFRQGQFENAIAAYRAGLLLDPGNYRLKYNLELANNAKKVAKQPNQNQKKEGNNKKDKEKKDRKNQDNKENNPAKKNAEKTLDAFKEKELNELRQSLNNKEKKSNVEKDW
jgi:Ca-activated chloride channel family protein